MENSRKPSVVKPWLKHYKKECIEAPLPECSMYAQLKKSSANAPNQTALLYYGTEITYSELMRKIDQYAAAFKEIGVKPGEYVTFFTVAVPETIYAIYGLNKIGAVLNFILAIISVASTFELLFQNSEMPFLSFFGIENSRLAATLVFVVAAITVFAILLIFSNYIKKAIAWFKRFLLK